MRIDKIHIQNFKCFEDSTFELNPHFNVIIGDNGKGKTAICDALAAVLGQVIFGNPIMHEVLRLLDLKKNGKTVDAKDGHKQFSSYKFERKPYAKDCRTIRIDGQPKRQTPLFIKFWGDIDSVYHDCEFKMEITDSIYPNSIATSYHSRGQSIQDFFVDKIQESRKKSGVIFPLIAYYGTGRLWGKDDDAIPYQKQEEGIMLAYPDCLVPNTTSAAFISWYKTIIYEVQQFNRERDKTFLKVINEAISSMIPGWKSMAFSFLEDDIVGILDEEERLFSQLSDGYRNTIGMVADMIYRCIQLNPHFGENVLKETPGVVLIDELDLHLHPNWQRRIVADLKRIFPKVQFVATTHSPFIVQSLKSDELINLDPDKGLENDPFKYSLEEIANAEMGVEQEKRSEKFLQMQEAAADFFQLVKDKADKAHIAKAKAKLDELRILFNHDPAYVALLESELPKD